MLLFTHANVRKAPNQREDPPERLNRYDFTKKHDNNEGEQESKIERRLAAHMRKATRGAFTFIRGELVSLRRINHEENKRRNAASVSPALRVAAS